MSGTQATQRPGRSCPLDYRYGAPSLRRAPDFEAETLLVAGGLYGNPFALAALLDMAAAEPHGATLVFNGDFHWFDIEAHTHARINAEVLAHRALRGNVETELALPGEEAGCGCGYPDWVGDAEVARSNDIMLRLRQTAQADAAALSRLAALPMHLVAAVGGERVGIVHGDADSLAGWDCSQEQLRDHPEKAAAQLQAAGVRVLATSHTCLPVLAAFELAAGRSVLANNGAAGMPNFAGTHYGLATRVSVHPAPRSLHGLRAGPLHVDAVAIEFDQQAWLSSFDHWWPEGSPAQLSYRRRIVAGPDYTTAQALRQLNPLALAAATG